MTERTTMNGKPVFTVPARTVVNFDSRFDKKLLCDGLTFTAGQACVYSCVWCYVGAMARKQQEWFQQHGVVYPPGGHCGVVIRNASPVETARRQIQSKPEEFRRAKKVIYASPKVDVAGNMELVRETVAMCRMILSETNWDIRLLSKSNLLPKIAQALSEWDIHDRGRARVIYGVSTGTLDDPLAAAMEQGTPKVSKRLAAIRWLQDNGYRTFGMICPSLPMEDYAGWARDMAQAIRADRCEQVWAEVINLRGDSLANTVAALDAAGFTRESARMYDVMTNPAAWERYARDTFLAHVPNYRPGQLRFLQYVTKATLPWWEPQRAQGAVLL